MKYGQKVLVTSWFYEGMEGIVQDECNFLWFKKYRVDLLVRMYSEFPVIIPESSLELIQ